MALQVLAQLGPEQVVAADEARRAHQLVEVGDARDEAVELVLEAADEHAVAGWTHHRPREPSIGIAGPRTCEPRLAAP